jgi:excinuclease ABC subunit C
MLQKVADFDYFVCATEKDALGLESNLIKKHKPHYNILLKDSKSFPYIRIVNAPFPYLEATRKLNQGGKYFGPYFNGIWAKDLLSVVQDIFNIRQCVHMGKEPCLNYQMEKCFAPCAGKISRDEYAAVIENVKSFLRGDKDFGARAILTQKMTAAAQTGNFELAIKYRESIKFLDKLKERTITWAERDVNCDVFAYAVRADIFVVSVLTVRAGKLIGIRNFSDGNKGVDTDEETLGGFIRQYYLQNVMPEEVVISAKIGYKKKLLDMARENAREYIETSIERIKFKNEFTLGACEELGRVLGLQIVPKKIECFDISHMGGEETVASMVVFTDGLADKRLYRKFRIRHGEGNNDFLSMNEVLTRRIKRLGGADDSFGTNPDLIIVDGGKGQLSAVLGVIPDGIKVCALAKREEEIFIPGKPEPIVLDRRSYALRLLQRIRDEAHRFAIDYQRKRRKL